MSEDVRRVWDQEREALREAGVDADAGIARMQTLHDQAVALNALQESLKRQLQATTAV